MCFMKQTEQQLMLSKINVTKYSGPTIVSVCIGWETSLYTNCNFRVEGISSTNGKGLQCIFPAIHPSRKDNSVTFPRLIPSTDPFSMHFWRPCSWHVLGVNWCHKLLLTVCATEANSVVMTWQSDWFDFSPNTHTTPRSYPLAHASRIQHWSYLSAYDLTHPNQSTAVTVHPGT